MKVLTGKQAQDEFISDAFIYGILSHQIRQGLIENKGYLRHGPETICILHGT